MLTITGYRFAAECVLIRVRHADKTRNTEASHPKYKDERLCVFRVSSSQMRGAVKELKTSAGRNYGSRYFLPSLRFLAQRALASRESFFLAARLIVGLVPLTCTAAALLVGTSARR